MDDVDKMYEVFYENEVDKPYHFRNDELPTIHDCMRYVISRTNHQNRSGKHTPVVTDLAHLVNDIWTKADCCPLSVRHIVDHFEKNVYSSYVYLKREKCLPGNTLGPKRSHKKNPAKAKSTPEPSRKSKRLSS